MRHNTGNKREKRGISVNNMIHRRPKTKETPHKETREYQTVHEQKKKERKRPPRECSLVGLLRTHTQKERVEKAYTERESGKGKRQTKRG